MIVSGNLDIWRIGRSKILNRILFCLKLDPYFSYPFRFSLGEGQTFSSWAHLRNTTLPSSSLVSNLSFPEA